MRRRDLAVAIAKERPGMPIVLAADYAERPAGAEIDLRRVAEPVSHTGPARATSDATKRRAG